MSLDPAHIYGLLTHPTIPPLTSALVMSQKLSGIDGKTFMLAFLTGFEVECKISEWMLPQHYVKACTQAVRWEPSAPTRRRQN
mgnify:CR=1 FL=1